MQSAVLRCILSVRLSLKFLRKVAMSVVRDSRKFSGHPYVGRIARSSLRQLSFLVINNICGFIDNFILWRRIHDKKVAKRQMFVTTLNYLTVKYQASYGEFRVKVLIFCYHGNKGRFQINFSGTVKLHNINNPLFGATFYNLYLIQAALYRVGQKK